MHWREAREMSQTPEERAFFVGGGRGRSPPGTGETVGKVFGIVLGTVLGIALLIGGAYAFYLWWQRRKARQVVAAN